ncbi:uncharacterized protein APUU_60856S [Aspergillus puulaauensis]|uniref:Rhamnogalacturonan I lyase beta-sheet domain-containing protein n=1 Tax=Aspergillus puulaauensis TaxID=1220207 RepID=A0A7R7XVS6_9EURO|nr:uncharacterized protein APUU_60856S [Aspergillus puulaauensis]BCS27808.1 hypothetical protein APUU_60856S [Aspergillus puulaauensis]
MWITKHLAVATATAILSVFTAAHAQRPMENLGRGVVAIRSADDAAFISWRVLGLDPEDIGFNLYRTTGDGNAELLNSDVLTGGSNYEDSSADLTQDNTYYVTTVVDGEESDASESWTLKADAETGPYFRIPIESGGAIRYIWVGDLDGDGEYDFVVDRQETPQRLEAYRRDGKRLWEVNLGPNSENQDNIEPGSSAIDLGHTDGVTVYDFDGDGYAEVALRISNGVVFGDGKTFEYDDDDHQFVAFLDGQTGALRATGEVPDDYIEDGPMAVRFGVGYLDGERPHLVAYMKNRKDSGEFNLIEAAYTFDGSSVDLAWAWNRDDQDAPDGHNTRIIDVDGDGVDEVAEIGFMLNGDGTLRYSLGPAGVVHGDRWHIAKIDPSRDGLQGYGVQQDNPSLLYEYYYDATNGTIIWEHDGAEEGDNGRGMAADIDPNYDGMETWSFLGLYNAASDELTQDEDAYPYPQLSVWWDGDELRELINDGNINKWDYEAGSIKRLVTTYRYDAATADGDPMFQGDILGDWREELVFTNGDYSELFIFTTDQPSDIRLYTLMHNPAYRNGVTLKGYVQDSHVDYFLGAGMETPEAPNITYVGA